ncbi:MAG: hypothetical protein FGM61_13450, partial [Sediminibacterium sp.]|nr:hypothetical protein [Sediminibacterium sp.]
ATDASTLGGEQVIINGKNFGNNATLIQARYTLNLKTPVTNRTNHTYTSPGCRIAINHTQLNCTTAPGVGQDLVWTITVDGQDNVSPKTAYTTPKIDRYEVRNTTSFAIKSADARDAPHQNFLW